MLLIQICEKIDGTLIKLAKFLLEILDFIILKNKETSIDLSNYKILNEFKNMSFLISNDQNNIVETILLVFSILNKQISKRNDIM